MKKFWNEFKTFAIKGNMLELAVGVVIGTTFKSVVDAILEDIINPILSLFGTSGKLEDTLIIPLGKTLEDGTQVGIRVGSLISTIINFLIVAFVLFLIIRGANRLKNLKKKEEVTAPTTKKCPFCQSEIDINATRCPHCTSELPKE